MTTQTQYRTEQEGGLRVPMGPFPARLRFEGTRLLLEVVVGQVTSSERVEDAWRQSGELLRSMFGPTVTGPELTYDLRFDAVIITYAADFDADWDEVQSMTMAGVLYAAFMAKALEPSLTQGWCAQLTAHRVLGPGMTDPRRLMGTRPALWEPWDQE